MDELKRFGDLVPGDVIVGTDGREAKVVTAYDEHMPESMYELELESGATIKASGNHLWYVETSLDYSLHRERRRVGRRFFGKLTGEPLKLLEEVATSEEPVETALIDMVFLLNAQDSVAATRAIERVAEAIGHIAENTSALQDLETGEMLEDMTVRTYDARVFAQQLLSLTGKRSFKKRWPLVVGRIITTEAMAEEAFTSEIPVAHQL